MKNKFTKVLLLALVLIMLVGTVMPAAYEPYDTYTYSIDGKPLKSTSAYTPAPTPYTSSSMGLLAGNHWRYDADGDVALWLGNMTPEKYLSNASDSFAYEHLDFELENGEFTVIGFKDAGAENDLPYIYIPATYENPTDNINYPVVAIADGVFASCVNTKAVIIGENVRSIGNDNFKSEALTELFYESVSDNWSKVTIGSGNSSLDSLTRYYYSANIKYGNTPLSTEEMDVVTDEEGNIYIADKTNNRIVVLNKYDYKAMGVIKDYTDEYNRKQTLSSPTGIYVTDPNKMVDGSSNIFVCDNANKRIVVFDREYNYVRTINEPKSPLLNDGDFTPYAIAVDIYGKIFVVSKTCSQGIIVLSGDGDFTGFIGSQKVTYDVMEQIWRRFQSDEDREADALNTATPFNNITVDDNGFVYATISFTDPTERQEQFAALKTKTAAYSPVKKLNSTGSEILNRNGFFDPGGEVDIKGSEELSNIIDVAIGPEGSWSILDDKRSRIFTYDSNGNLLFAFGDMGSMNGNGTEYVAMTYQALDLVDADEDGAEAKKAYNIVLLDKTQTGTKLVVFNPTEYYDMIMTALGNENANDHAATIEAWQQVLTSNNNFDLAYIGIGKALFNQGKYDEAMEMLESAYETEYYAKAFSEKRKDILSVWLIPVLILAIVVLVFFFKFLGWAKKKNKAVSLKVGKKTYLEELLYVFHLVFHPFDGFWDLKHEKRGSVRAASTILGLTVLAFFYQAIGQGYMFNTRGNYSSVVLQFVAVIVVVLLWVVANWCLTTLFDGEGSFKDIYIATCYSLAPLPLFIIISTALSNVLTLTEGSIVTLIVAIGYVWVGILLFFGMVVTHDYTTGKNVITTIGTIAAMLIILFIVILFSSLVVKMITLIVAIIQEIGNRL